MTTDRLKIAIIESVGAKGGMNYYDFSLCSTLSKAGITPFLFTSRHLEKEKSDEFNVYYYFKGLFSNLPRFIRGIFFTCQYLFILIKLKIDHITIVHFHFFQFTRLEWLQIWLSRIFDFRIVSTVHDAESFLYEDDQKIKSYIFSTIDRIIVHNQVSRDHLLSVSPGLENKISIIPHGNYLNFVKHHPRNIGRETLHLNDEDKILLFFGHIKEVKGLDILLHALPKVILSYPNLKLIIAGKVLKDDFQKYEQIIQKNNLEKNIIRKLQYIDNELANHYFSASDVIILPYRKIFQSGVLLMAMSYQKPVLASDLPGMAEIIEHGSNGYLFRSEDPNSLADSLLGVLDNDVELRKVALNGYDFVKEVHNWTDIGIATANVYQQLNGNIG